MGGRGFLLGGEAGAVKAALKRRTPCGWSAGFLLRGMLLVIAVFICAGICVGAPQAAGAGQDAKDAKDACAPVQAAYQKTASVSNSSNATNTGALNVAEAYEKISTEPGHRETCK